MVARPPGGVRAESSAAEVEPPEERVGPSP